MNNRRQQQTHIYKLQPVLLVTAGMRVECALCEALAVIGNVIIDPTNQLSILFYCQTCWDNLREEQT